MTYDKDRNLYIADEGKMFVCKADGKVFGDRVQLGRNGSIDNYEERVFTEEERAAFWKSVGMDDPKKLKKQKKLKASKDRREDRHDA